ncbi:hypothetical protein TSUD_16330 [Trifolium subterraneum]|uniref:Uncharacterized protein n=1 Tax=Trifolium subterraneum TaxID=3900 RepID=A0A2Z6NDU9_TRISU|nr:hypothetical protein TSUD_16330 [Trifolium subterraneum]
MSIWEQWNVVGGGISGRITEFKFGPLQCMAHCEQKVAAMLVVDYGNCNIGQELQIVLEGVTPVKLVLIAGAEFQIES